jgi:hypothetical protein
MCISVDGKLNWLRALLSGHTSPIENTLGSFPNASFLGTECLACEGLEGEVVKNILLPKQLQNAEWFQSSTKTLFNFNIFTEWHCEKMHNASTSFESFCNKLTSKWGLKQRDRPGVASASNSIPYKVGSRDTAVKKSNFHLRYTLNLKRLKEFIVRCTIVSILNDDFHGSHRYFNITSWS